MKGKKTIFALTAGVLAVVSLAGCGKKKDDKPAVKDEVTGISFAQANYTVAPGGSVQVAAVVTGTGNYDATVTYSIPDTATNFSIEGNVVTAKPGLESVGKSVIVTAVANGDKTKTATTTVKTYELANGYADYSDVDATEKAKILGALEKYAVDTHLTGLTIMGNGGYVMYDTGITKGTNNYIPGYGFGILGEGRITSPLTGPSVQQKYNMYYHTASTVDPQYLLYMNSKESQVGTFSGYLNATYFDTEMNRTKDGYNWVGDLAKVNRPIPLNLDESTGKATKYKFPVKVGAEIQYSTKSQVERFKKYDGRNVALEDYITPYQIYYTQQYGLVRSTENLTKAASLKGTKDYYTASKDGFNQAAWDNVGIKAYVDETDGLSYLEFEFNYACTPFFAMTYLTGSMFAPVPKDFILECAGAGNTDLAAGVAAWGSNDKDGNEVPSDRWLSTGPWVIAEWNIDENVIFEKNTRYADRGRFQIAGIHYAIIPGAAEDNELLFKEFLAGNLSAAGIPSTQLAQYKNDPRTTTTSSDSNFKLNLNTCSPELWEEMFGPNGTIAKNTSAWDVKPIMSNKAFLDGMSYSLDRVSFCDKIGRVATCEYFSDDYLIDPENGISYNSTQAHKDAMAGMLEGTDGFGYSLELAKKCFKQASEELVRNGDAEVDETIHIELCWMYESDIDEYAQIPQNIEDAFNACGGPLKLKIDVIAVSNPYDVYYNKLMIGKFDIAFGAISGDPYDPLDFFEVLKSDNSSGYTLNWGVDTNEVDGSIIYDGKVWSFDALWEAGMKGGIAKDGQAVSLVELQDYEVERAANGDLVVYLWANFTYVDDKNYARLSGICLYAALTDPTVDYSELYITVADKEHCRFDEKEGCWVFTFDADLIAEWLKIYTPQDKLERQGFDLYLDYVINGKEYDKYYELDEAGTVGCYYTSFWQNKVIPEIPQP